MVKEKQTINLIPKEELGRTPIGKFLEWSLNFGRYIVIFTELIVIIAFLARFKLDLDLAKIHEEIRQKQGIINSLEELENNVRLIQKRLEIIKKTDNENLKPSKVLNELSKITPFDVFFSELTVNPQSLSLKGESLSNVGLSTLLNGLQLSEQFSQINLESVSSKGRVDPTLKFELSVKLGKDKK